MTTLTPELEREGLSREFVRRVQDLRKTADLDISDRIDVVYEASSELAEAIRENAGYISNETLAVSLEEGPVPADWASVEDFFRRTDGQGRIKESIKNGVIRFEGGVFNPLSYFLIE